MEEKTMTKLTINLFKSTVLSYEYMIERIELKNKDRKCNSECFVVSQMLSGKKVNPQNNAYYERDMSFIKKLDIPKKDIKTLKKVKITSYVIELIAKKHLEILAKEKYDGNSYDIMQDKEFIHDFIGKFN